MTPERPTVKVLMSPELIEQWASRDIDCNGLIWSWGEPDADGFYTPTVTRDFTDNPLDEARAHVTRLADVADDVYAARADADRLAEALRLTQEYVGDEMLPPIAGWSWFDALAAHEALKPPKKAVAYTNVTNDDWVMADADETQEP